MTRKHTRGPWMTLPDEADKPYVRIRGSLAGSRFKVANVLKPIYENPPKWEEEETRANVRLIEAAPDLLDQLRVTVLFLQSACLVMDADSRQMALETVKEARAVIAKATGT